jgi:glycosyltransferase involved in cell wall biosynthesis
MKILMSALACEPGNGSELEVGFRALLAAASRHEVWVLTNSATVPVVRRAIEGFPWADRVHLEGIYFDVSDEMYSHLTAPGFHRYYDRWQRKAGRRAVELARVVDFDVVHHVTLAASWTRAGVTRVAKPLVWGPVGGAVEPPRSLFAELGWRGLLDEAARTAARRLLVRFGPARSTQARAVVTFAQNSATLRVLRTHGRAQVLSNATAVDVQGVDLTGLRRTDIVFAARLLPWKGGRLAVRALRYVRHPGAVLRLFGDGPERGRIAAAAQKWGVSDRVRFEGRVPRDELLRQIATGGVFLHPAFHDEAGLAVAEALSLGTPVVCLDRGGPSELLCHWPDAKAEAVRPESPEQTARALAAAIDRFLSDAPPVATAPRRSGVSFEGALLAAYDEAVAVDGHRAPAPVWAFPAGNPQVYADTPRALSNAVTVYGFGRRLPRWALLGLSLQVRAPGVRRFIAEPALRPEPVCSFGTWLAIRDEVWRRNGQPSLEWVHFHSPWGKARSNFLGLDHDGTPRVFVVVAREDTINLRNQIVSTPSFRVTQCTGTFSHDGWSVRQYEPLPRLHRPAKWDADRIRRAAEDVPLALPKRSRPKDVPAHWRPIHGDYVPWNLREDDSGQLWLLDWEDAGWGPPKADLTRYVVAYHSLGWSSPEATADAVRRSVAPELPAMIAELAEFWLSHPNLQLDQATRLTGRRARDAARAAREIAAFQVLARDG